MTWRENPKRLAQLLREVYRSLFPSPSTWEWRYRIKTDENGEFHYGLIDFNQTIHQITAEAGAGIYVLTIKMQKMPGEK